MTVVRERDGNGHAVLMVRTDRGDLILDNQNGKVLLWNDTNYEYVKRQSQADAGKWVGINDDRFTVIAAAN
jgi:predicted transglutaminase-like cysteine proteinase